MTQYPVIDKSLIAPELWERYKLTKDYIVDKKIFGISSVHPLIKEAEEYGLAQVIKNFLEIPSSSPNFFNDIIKKTGPDWISEWQNMHSTLFKYVYKNYGQFRKSGEDVYFGNIAEAEDLYKIPKGNAVSREIYEASYNLSNKYPASINKTLNKFTISSQKLTILLFAFIHFSMETVVSRELLQTSCH